MISKQSSKHEGDFVSEVFLHPPLFQPCMFNNPLDTYKLSFI